MDGAVEGGGWKLRAQRSRTIEYKPGGVMSTTAEASQSGVFHTTRERSLSLISTVSLSFSYLPIPSFSCFFVYICVLLRIKWKYRHSVSSIRFSFPENLVWSNPLDIIHLKTCVCVQISCGSINPSIIWSFLCDRVCVWNKKSQRLCG